MTDAPITVDFAGEEFRAVPGETITVGRSADIAIDDNPYLHRVFLEFATDRGFWWVHNRGSRLAAYLTHEAGALRSTLSPGSALPLVMHSSLVTFGAGSTLYELEVTIPGPVYASAAPGRPAAGETTITPGPFTESQLLALVALAEPVLQRKGTGAGRIPSTQEAAQRLGWSSKRFDKKLENVCDKLAAAGVRGLRGEGVRMASNRRLHLVEYAVSTLLVTADDLSLLELGRAVDDEEEPVS